MTDQMDERSYMLARKELQRIINMAGERRTDFVRQLARGSIMAVDTFAGGMGVSHGMARSIRDYAQDMRYLVVSYRDARRKMVETTPIKTAMGTARKIAAHRVEEMRKRGHIAVTVFCNAAYGGAELASSRLNRSWEIRLGPNWKRRVYDRGIALADTTAGQVFVMQAKPKSSAFLKDEGIAVFEAEVYQSSASGGAQTGYVFKSAGPTDGSDFVIFHEDFMRGVNLIRRRITRGVLDALLGQEEVQ